MQWSGNGPVFFWPFSTDPGNNQSEDAVGVDSELDSNSPGIAHDSQIDGGEIVESKSDSKDNVTPITSKQEIR